MIDFHTHVLPGIDDGSKSVAQSLVMLEQLAKMGVTQVVATPHFYPDQQVHTFLEKRQAAYELLAAQMDVERMPEIRLGAEVLVGADLCEQEGLENLCIQGTRYMLLEMPYGAWGSWVEQVVDELIARGITPIIAHVERFEGIVGIEAISKLMSKEVLGQINSYSFATPKLRKLCCQLVKHHMVQVIGSDVHRVRQLPSVEEGIGFVQKKFGQQMLDELQANSQEILADRVIPRGAIKPIRKIMGFYI